MPQLKVAHSLPPKRWPSFHDARRSLGVRRPTQTSLKVGRVGAEMDRGRDASRPPDWAGRREQAGRGNRALRRCPMRRERQESCPAIAQPLGRLLPLAALRRLLVCSRTAPTAGERICGHHDRRPGYDRRVHQTGRNGRRGARKGVSSLQPDRHLRRAERHRRRHRSHAGRSRRHLPGCT